ncbi:MAG: HAMP domain-containing histidine kinase [Polyangiaceae bacterium]|nr:HAMP domain-containing histidine kinase [Polyangiaceae bacterium]
MKPAVGFALKLLVLQTATHSVTYMLVVLFAPRVLLLEQDSASGANQLAIAFLVLAVLFSTATTFTLVHPLCPALGALAARSSAIGEVEVRLLDAAPARLSLANVGFVLTLSVATLAPALRPKSLDLYNDLAVVLLVLTMVSTAALAAYIMLRASVTKVLERAPPEVMRVALSHLGRTNLGSIRTRFMFAVAAPVAFVALGASLLVAAHARAYDREARIADATSMARAVFEPGRSEQACQSTSQSTSDCDNVQQRQGRAEAIEAAAAFGFAITLAPSVASEPGARDRDARDEGETQLVVPTSPGVAIVRFGTSRPAPVVVIYVVLALAAVLLAAILGSRIAIAFEADVALARREVQKAGVDEVMRGTIIVHQARFSVIHSLLQAIDALGAVFREFAGAQKRAIEASERTEQMRGFLLASMSHDLKAPLNAVLGFAELAGRHQLTANQRESLAIIEQRGRELLMLIDTILDSARAEARELEIIPVTTRVYDIVMSAVLEARDLVVGTDVQIKGEVQPGIPMLFVDATRIVQALTAVVMTAVRFGKKSVVVVRATLPDKGDRLRIEVETSGEGLPHSEREKIFDAFKSAQSARRHGALGLGLQLARSIVEIHGGSIEMDNTEGGGMVFRMWLPVDHAPTRDRAITPTVAD